MKNEQFRDFLTLIKNPSQIDTRKIMRKCSPFHYSEPVDMSCMKYECIIDTNNGKLNSDKNNIKINIGIDNSKSNREAYKYQKGIALDIILPLQNILNIIPLDTRELCNADEVDNYVTITDLKGYHYINITHISDTIDYKTDIATLIVDITLEAYSDHAVYWTVHSSKNDHSILLKWEDYNEYISFYSHIIKVIANNLGHMLLAKYDLLGE